ncbi:MAG: putative capsular polysaccharide synthesis family protein [Butyrivibrio sp.]|nr:putative capsular polysaccharide synthesis family protein [Butyrivibrio sp.]
MRFSFVDDSFELLKNSKVVIFGTGNNGMFYYKRLLKWGIKTAFFCDNNKDRQLYTIDGISIISVDKLAELYDENTIVCVLSIYWNEIVRQLSLLGIDNIIILDEFKRRTEDIAKLQTFNDKNLMKEYINCKDIYYPSDIRYEGEAWDYAFEINSGEVEEAVYICTPPSTGNRCISKLCLDNNIKHCNLWNSTYLFTDNYKKLISATKIKIITGVRETVGQNISAFMSHCQDFWDVEYYWKNGGDVQYLWDSWISKETELDYQWDRDENKNRIKAEFPYASNFEKYLHFDFVIQKFWDNQIKNFLGIDVLNYQFDKEKGYGIVESGNVEIFIYQLEKLDSLQSELSNFLGITITGISHENEGSKRWYSQIYKKFSKEIILSEEYISKCYDSDLIRHFYCDEDIFKYKSRWQKKCKNV